VVKKHSPSRDFERGNQLHQRGNMPAAVEAYRRHLARHPKDKSGHHNLAVTFEAVHQIEAAIHSYGRAIEIDPWYPEALNNLGVLYHSQANFDVARQYLSRALAANPDYEDAEYNLATTESSSGNYQQAVLHFSHVLERNPQRATAWNNLGNTFLALRSPADALKVFEIALSLQPQLPDARWNSSVARLTLGQLPAGWDGFDLRGKLRHTSIPRWSLSSPPDHRVLVHAEQGFGDTIQFVRYCTGVRARASHVTLECQPALIPLLGKVAGVDTAIGIGDPLPAVDSQIPLMSLPGVFRSAIDTIPAVIPYIAADPDLILHWQSRMAAPKGNLPVGLVWAGNAKHRNDRNRSIDPALLSLLGQPENVSFYSLQQKPQSESATGIPFAGIYDELTFPDTAAIISNLGLVVSVDTAVAHLTGALGKPVWTLLPFAPDWRWMLDRTDSPWYPTMRLFRQPRLHDWQAVLAGVKCEIQELARK
jgi:Tfp pilus assembly protein PilF